MLETFLRVVGIIFPVFACAILGMAYCRKFRPDMSTINRMNLDVFSPLLIFWALVDKPFNMLSYTGLCIGAAAVILGPGLLLWPICRAKSINIKTFLPPMMFNNSGNMGLPLLIFAFGDTALQPAVVMLIVGMLLQFTVGVFMLDRRVNLIEMLKNPILIATMAGLSLNGLGVQLPSPINNTIEMLGQVAIPLLLFSLGARLLEVDLGDWRLGTFGAVAGPAAGIISALLALAFIELTPLETSMLLVFAALPPAVFNLLLAEQFNQQPDRVASIVMLGNLASLLIIPATLWFTLP